MKREWYQKIAAECINGRTINREVMIEVLHGPEVELLPLLDSAFQVRRHFHGREITIHILNNVKNGRCPEDCSYCAQSRDSRAEIAEYPTKDDTEILAEARQAYEAGAHRYCMVYAGRGPSSNRVNRLVSLIEKIKNEFPLEVCVSAGILDQEAALLLKKAGLDRLNHNLNTTQSRYGTICTTHTYGDRLNTLRAARAVGLEVCSGIIAGMGEGPEDLVELAVALREVDARSIPVNFLLPIEGNVLHIPRNLTPEYCLRILCMFRFANPEAEIRVAAGREDHLRSMEVLSLYPANSLFMDGYLNTRGDSREKTLQMIRDSGFTIRSDKELDDLLARERALRLGEGDEKRGAVIKSATDLRPALSR